MGCLTIVLTIPLPWLGLFMSGKPGHAIGALILQVVGIGMLFFAIIPVIGWLIAILGAFIIMGNMFAAVFTVVNAKQGVQNIEAHDDDE